VWAAPVGRAAVVSAVVSAVETTALEIRGGNKESLIH
jgi:hypothetical protein